MQVFKIALRLIRRNWLLFAVYVAALSVMGAFMGSSVGGGLTGSVDGSYEETLPKAAVVDRDGSAVSRALAAYVRANSTYVEVADSAYALQDAAARDLASYVLVIPAGWGDGLLAAARAGGPAPDLECIVSYMGASGSLMDQRVRGWAQELYALAAASAAPAQDLVSWLGDVQDERVPVSVAQADQEGVPAGYLVYCQFATYPLFGGIAAIVATGLASLRDPDVRRRVGASCVGEAAFARQVAAAIGVCGVVVWAASAGLGLALYRNALAGVPVGAVVLMLGALFALGLVGTAFGFLLWQLGVSHQVAHAVANIASMVLTFLAGTWVSVDQMGQGMEALARFTPGYWCVDALTAVYEAPAVTGDLAARVAADAALVALFAVVIALAAVAAGRVRRQRALG